MKKVRGILSLVMALFVVLSTVAVHHHHHFSEICFAQEKCAIDGHVNDRHTSHKHSGEGDDDDSNNCSVTGVKIYISDDKADVLIPQILDINVLTAVLSEQTIDIPEMPSWEMEASAMPAAAVAAFVSADGLRAPPAV